MFSRSCCAIQYSRWVMSFARWSSRWSIVQISTFQAVCSDPNSLLPRDPSLLDHFAPLARITSHAVPHFFRSSSTWIDAKNAELLLQIRSSQTTVDLGIEQSPYLRRHARASANSIPARDNVTREATLLGSWHFHQQWITILSSRGDDPHFAWAEH